LAFSWFYKVILQNQIGLTIYFYS
ncbi:hypothetical protein CP061683_1338B, partial [Chlamydia psittaci 06-1683]